MDWRHAPSLATALSLAARQIVWWHWSPTGVRTVCMKWAMIIHEIFTHMRASWKCNHYAILGQRALVNYSSNKICMLLLALIVNKVTVAWNQRVRSQCRVADHYRGKVMNGKDRERGWPDDLNGIDPIYKVTKWKGWRIGNEMYIAIYRPRWLVK